MRSGVDKTAWRGRACCDARKEGREGWRRSRLGLAPRDPGSSARGRPLFRQGPPPPVSVLLRGFRAWRSFCWSWTEEWLAGAQACSQ